MYLLTVIFIQKNTSRKKVNELESIFGKKIL